MHHILLNYNLSEIGLFVTPQKGKILIFFNHLPSGEIDPLAIHAGLPVGHNYFKDDNIAPKDSAMNENTESGEKWIANYWFQFDTKN